MATEDDKTNTGIAGTALAVGVAAMIAGSTAIVGMTRTEIDEWSNASSAYADLSSVKALKGEQAQQLASAKLPIDKARARTLTDLKRNPDEASPWTPKPAPSEVATSAASTETAPSTETSGASSAPAASASDGSMTSAPAPGAGASNAPPVPNAPVPNAPASNPAAGSGAPEAAPSGAPAPTH